MKERMLYRRWMLHRLSQTSDGSHRTSAFRKHECFLCSSFYGRACRWAMSGKLEPQGPEGLSVPPTAVGAIGGALEWATWMLLTYVSSISHPEPQATLSEEGESTTNHSSPAGVHSEPLRAAPCLHRLAPSPQFLSKQLSKPPGLTTANYYRACMV